MINPRTHSIFPEIFPLPSSTSIHAAAAVQASGKGKCHYIYQSPNDRLKQASWRGRCRYFNDCGLKNTSLTVERGEPVASIGRNGSGKPTQLPIIAGIGGFSDQAVNALMFTVMGLDDSIALGKVDFHINAAMTRVAAGRQHA